MGEYYLISEGYDKDGMITTKIKGTFNNNLGILSSSFYKEICQNTVYGENQFEGNKTNDVIYDFELDKLSNLKLNYFAFLDTTNRPTIPMQISIIYEDDEIVYSDKENNSGDYKSFPLKKGRYRIVLEGVKTDGVLVLYMKNSKFRSSNDLGQINPGYKKELLSSTSYLSDPKEEVVYNFRSQYKQSIQLSNIEDGVFVELLHETGKNI